MTLEEADQQVAFAKRRVIEAQAEIIELQKRMEERGRRSRILSASHACTIAILLLMVVGRLVPWASARAMVCVLILSLAAAKLVLCVLGLMPSRPAAAGMK